MKLDELKQKIRSSLSGIYQRGLQTSQQIAKHSFIKKGDGTQIQKVQSTLACDFGRSKILFLEVEKSAEGVKLVRFQKTARQAGQGKPAELLKQFYEAGGYGTRKVRVSVKGQGVVTRFIQFPKMKPEELRSAVTYEVEKYIPFKYNEVVVDFHILDDNVTLASGPGMNLLLVAVKKDDLNGLLQTFRDAALEVELVDVDAIAAINALEFFHPESFKSSVGILDIGAELSTFSVVKDGKPRFIRDISYGGADLAKLLKRKLGLSDQAAQEQLEVDRVPTPETVQVVKQGLGNLVADLKVSIDYYMDQSHSTAEPLKALFISGGGGYHATLIETLTADLSFPVQDMDMLSKIRLGEGIDAEFVKKNQSLLAVSLGLCLRDV